MAEMLFGKPVADAISERLVPRIEALRKAQGSGEHDMASDAIIPKLAIARVGERPDDLSYERGALKRADALGIEVEVRSFPEDTSEDELIGALERINSDESIHGCLLFRPLPPSIDEARVCNALLPAKDVDGITTGSLAGVFMDQPWGFPPCTAQACVELLDHYGIEVAGKRVVVVGRSLVIGKPVAMMLLAKNATVTLCHSRSQDLGVICQEAEVVLFATGRARAYGEEFISAGQTVLDVGINVNEAGDLCGDVDFDEVEDTAHAITPVPRGIGSVTTAVLMQHVVEAAERAAKIS